MSGPSIIRSAHGTAAKGGQLLVAETPVLDEVPPLNAASTEEGLAVAARRGRPFERGNRAGSLRGPSLTRPAENPDAPAEQRRVDRRASTLSAARVREMTVAHGGGRLSTAVRTEIVAWARAVAWSDHYYRHGDTKQGARLAELASAHQLRAVGLAEREGAARPAGADDACPPGFEYVEDDDGK